MQPDSGWISQFASNEAEAAAWPSSFLPRLTQNVNKHTRLNCAQPCARLSHKALVRLFGKGLNRDYVHSIEHKKLLLGMQTKLWIVQPDGRKMRRKNSRSLKACLPSHHIALDSALMYHTNHCAVATQWSLSVFVCFSFWLSLIFSDWTWIISKCGNFTNVSRQLCFPDSNDWPWIFIIWSQLLSGSIWTTENVLRKKVFLPGIKAVWSGYFS